METNTDNKHSILDTTIYKHCTKYGVQTPNVNPKEQNLQAINDKLNLLLELTQNNILNQNNSNQNNSLNNLLTISSKKEDMKRIIKRKDNRYMIRKTINGERITIYRKTLLEAQKVLSILNKKKDIEQLICKKLRTTKFYDFTEKWFNTYKKPFINDKSAKGIYCIVKLIYKKFKNTPIKSITTDRLQDYINTLKKNRTKERICLYFNAILEKATELQVINYNPFKAVIKDKKIKYKRYCYNIDEQEKIINNCDKYGIKKEILIYLMTGCRPNEIPSKENFDFENNIIHIYGTKTENSKHRQIEMTHEFANYIKSEFEREDTKKFSVIQTLFKNMCNELKIKDSNIYRLRHTFASNHFVLGTQAKQVQEWLGHSTIMLTMDTYTDIDKSITKDKLKKLYNNYYYIKSQN